MLNTLGTALDLLRPPQPPIGCMHAGGKPCALQFQRYAPGGWEARWLRDRDKLSKRICKTVAKQADSVAAWIKAVRPFLDGTAPLDDRLLRGVLDDGDTWSRFVYKDSCSGGQVEVPIEPLIGLMRHPTAHTSCRWMTSCARLLPMSGSCTRCNACFGSRQHNSPISLQTHTLPPASIQAKGAEVDDRHSARPPRRWRAAHRKQGLHDGEPLHAAAGRQGVPRAPIPVRPRCGSLCQVRVMPA